MEKHGFKEEDILCDECFLSYLENIAIKKEVKE